MTSSPRLPPLPSSILTSMVTFASPALITSRSVSAVIRSFSSASLAFDKSSRRKTSLCEYSEWMTSDLRREMSDWMSSQ